jgi:cytochrome c553
VKAILPLAVAATIIAAAPALSQSLGLGKLSREQTQPKNFHPDANRGRFVAFGGEFGSLRISCASCHQIDGTADPSGAFPRLSGQSAWYLYSTLRDFADGKRPSAVMTPIARDLSDGQMQDVAAFYATVGHQPYPPQAEPDAQAIASGRSTAQSGDAKAGIPPCDSCHGMKGQGNPPLYPYLGGQFASYLQRQLELFKSGKRHGDPMRIMETIASKLSNQQIEAVADYYASLAPQNVSPGNYQIESMKLKNRVQSSQPTPAPNEESVLHVGAVKNPQPGKPSVVVPNTPTNGNAGQGE